jgi:Short C-terminal domain
MPIGMRRRPLMRAAMVGGAGYAVGKSRQRSQASEYDQEQRIQDLEQQQANAGQPVAAPPPPPAAAPPAPQTDMVEQLKQLSDLKAAGALSNEEFEAAKQKLLAG